MQQVSAWVARFARHIGPGEVLDLACGSGRHARLLAGRGHPVLALDRDPAALALAQAPGVQTMAFDLEQGAPWPFAPRRFAGIVVTHYLHRPILPALFDSLGDGGVLIYETFAEGNAQFGKPSRPDFLLRPGELLDVCRTAGREFHVLAYEDGHQVRPRPAMTQRICVLRREAVRDPVRLRLD